MIREFFGNDESDAVRKASEALGIPQEKLKHRLLPGEFGNTTRGRKVGILAEFEAQAAAPTAAPKSANLEEEQRAREGGESGWAAFVCDGIFTRMGLETRTKAIEKGENTVLEVEILDGQLDLRRGEGRDLRGAIQHLINRAVARGGADSERKFIIDIGATLEKRTAVMTELASAVSDKVVQLGQSFHIHLMDSQDRRILHLALMGNPAIKTEGKGGKQFRILSLEPKSN